MKLATILTRTPDFTLEQWQALSWFYRWLVMIRAVVLVMTVSATMTGILAALIMEPSPGQFLVVHLDRLLCLVLGLVFAHGTNNLLNDWTDHRRGIDKGNYFRRRYGVHVLEEQLVSEAVFLRVIVFTGSIAVICGLYLVSQIGADIFYLMFVGSLFVFFYTWPLKHLALGELSVLLVWGPLIVGGSYFVVAGNLPFDVILLSLVYGIGPTLVIIGKHLDKYDDDKQRGVLSLPVALGRMSAQYIGITLAFMQWLLLLFLLFRQQLLWLLLCVFAITQLTGLVRCFANPVPVVKPESYPADVWPLWYSALAFRYTQVFGGLLLLALILQLLQQWLSTG